MLILVLVMQDLATIRRLRNDHFPQKSQRGHLSRFRQAGMQEKNARLFMAGPTVNFHDQHGFL